MSAVFVKVNGKIARAIFGRECVCVYLFITFTVSRFENATVIYAP